MVRFLAIAAMAVTLALLPLTLPAQPVDISGDWSGSLDTRAGSLRLVIHLKADGTGTMDSLDQAAFGIPISGATASADAVVFAVPSVNGRYEGKFQGGRIEGTWSQSGSRLPLAFTRAAIEKPKRPQEPRRPFPYDEREVTFRNGEITLAGTLTVPRQGKPIAAVVLVSGSGPQDRDETIFGHKPFLVLADALTRRGMAVLRYDDRGTGASQGQFGTATTLDFTADAEAALAFLKTAAGGARLGVLGHSEGAVIAPIVASRQRDVSFLVLLAGTAVPGEQVLYAQSEALLRAQGMPAEASAANQALQRRIFEILRREPDNGKAAAEIQTIAGEGQARGAATPWFRQFLDLDPAHYLRQVKVPVLALFGALDLQVLPSQNLPVMAKALEQGGNTAYTISKVPGVNHLFQTATTGGIAEYGRIEETIAPRVLEEIGDWIANKVR